MEQVASEFAPRLAHQTAYVAGANLRHFIRGKGQVTVGRDEIVAACLGASTTLFFAPSTDYHSA